jgi:hypothetical protein
VEGMGKKGETVKGHKVCMRQRKGRKGKKNDDRMDK